MERALARLFFFSGPADTALFDRQVRCLFPAPFPPRSPYSFMATSIARACVQEKGLPSPANTCFDSARVGIPSTRAAAGDYPKNPCLVGGCGRGPMTFLWLVCNPHFPVMRRHGVLSRLQAFADRLFDDGSGSSGVHVRFYHARSWVFGGRFFSDIHGSYF